MAGRGRGGVRVVMLVALVALVGSSLRVAAAGDFVFSTQCLEENTYIELIQGLRARLTKGVSSVYDIPVLKQTVPDSERFVLVDLSNYAHTIAVVVDVINANVVAYLAGNHFYLFQDSPKGALDTLSLSREETTTFGFNSTYAGLEEAAGQSRDQISLGISPLDTAISSLSCSDSQTSVASSLLVVIQMLSEAARFRAIETRVRVSIRYRADFKPDTAMINLENNWADLSLQIQQSVQGVFSVPVQLGRYRNTSRIVTVESVTSIYVKSIAFLLYQCKAGASASASASASSQSQIIRSVVGDAEICQISRSTPVRINGWNGLCVDVKDGSDADKNSIQLWSCGQQRNQQWIFDTDGTIRSLKKCMTTYGFTPGNYIMIYNCGTAVAEATKWKLSTDGTITNPTSGLVLSAQTGQSRTTLTVQKNSYAMGQSWGVGMDVEPVVTLIIGFKTLCLQVNENRSSVWLEECAYSNKNQRWAIYGDGSIRVDADRSLCLTSDGSTSTSLIVICACQGGANQRWLFKNDGSLINPASGLAVDLKGSDVTLHQIILYRPTGKANQQWLPYF